MESYTLWSLVSGSFHGSSSFWGSPKLCCFCCSVARLRPVLCSPMDRSMPGFPVLHYLLELAQVHVHWVSDSIQPSHPLPLPVLWLFPVGFYCSVPFCCMAIPHLTYPFTNGWKFRLFQIFGYYEKCSYEYLCTFVCVCVDMFSLLLDKVLRVEQNCWVIWWICV